MGLQLNYELRLPATASPDEVDEVLAGLQRYAITLPFEQVSPIIACAEPSEEEWSWFIRVHAKIAARFDGEGMQTGHGDPDTGRGFLIHPGRGSEAATVGFAKRLHADGSPLDWFWWCGCKTQYASMVSDAHLVKCHTTLVAFLDHAIATGLDVVVRDETHYWETRDTERLVAEVHEMNRIVARIAGKFSDAIGTAADVRAPIFDHRNFEHLEMGEEQGTD